MAFYEYTCVVSTPHHSESFDDVSFILIPGTDGKVGILPRHAPMVLRLKAGVMAFYKKGSLWRHYFVWGGMASVNTQVCHILTEFFVLLDELDPIVLEEHLERYQNDLSTLTIEDERRTVSYEIAIAEAMIAALKEHNTYHGEAEKR